MDHVFTIQSPDWGFSDLLPLKETISSEDGFVVDDTLQLKANVKILTKSHPGGHGGGAAQQPSWTPLCSSKRQAIVCLNVGGQSFRIAQSTLTRFPNSLLTKMVEEFPELVEKGEELYVDRNPKAFPWIQEIYRCLFQSLTSLYGWQRWRFQRVCAIDV